MPSILQNHHVLAVHDLRGSAAFFRDVLGFRVVDEPPGWVFLARDRCMMMLGECADALPPASLGDHSYFGYLLVDDAEAWYAEVKPRGGEAVGPLADKPWGMREFHVRTPEGHRLMVGQVLAPAAAGGSR